MTRCETPICGCPAMGCRFAITQMAYCIIEGGGISLNDICQQLDVFPSGVVENIVQSGLGTGILVQADGLISMRETGEWW
jgi:hypothetical protein